MKKIDLHVHSSCSDGNLTIAEILNLAKNSNLSTIAITDHETIINLLNYEELEQKYGLSIIPGIELPTDIFKMHIVGYGIKDMSSLESEMNALRIENEKHNRETIDILARDGVDISYDSVKLLANGPNITYRDIVKYLYIKGYVNDPRDAFRKYIGQGCKAYVPSRSLSANEVLNLIDSCGGISILAHPFTINKDIELDCLVGDLKSNGLSGIEIYPPKLTSAQFDEYRRLAKKYQLIETIGTDFHNSSYHELGVLMDDDYVLEITQVLKRGKV